MASNNRLDRNGRKHLARTAILHYLPVFFILLVITFALRAGMNMLNRVDFIVTRMDDYPHLLEHYLDESREWTVWWQREDFQKRADQAAFYFDTDEVHSAQNKRLDYIAELLGAEKAEIIKSSDLDEITQQYSEEGLTICSSELSDGRLIVMGMPAGLPGERLAGIGVDDREALVRQMQAGLQGYVLVFHNGKATIFPQDESADSIRNMVSHTLGGTNPDSAVLKDLGFKLATRDDGSILVTLSGAKNDDSTKTSAQNETVTPDDYRLFCSSYAGTDDIVVNVVKKADLIRLAQRRSWAMWFLCCAIVVLIGHSLWTTKLYNPIEPDEQDISAEENEYDRRAGDSKQSKQQLRYAARKGSPALLMSGILLFISIIIIQLLSNVNQNAMAVDGEALFIRSVLEGESERSQSITAQFDEMYTTRAQTAAQFLVNNRQLYDLDDLHLLDTALDGNGLFIYSPGGMLTASDDFLLQPATDTQTTPSDSSQATESKSSPAAQSLSSLLPATETEGIRSYRANMVNESGNTVGLLELRVEQSRLDELLQATQVEDVIEDIRLMDTVHVVAVEDSKEHPVIASTWSNWIGDKVEDHGVEKQYIYNGYEGVIEYDKNSLYSSVFSYLDNFILVASESSGSFLLNAGGILILFIALFGSIILLVFMPMVRRIPALQKSSVIEEGTMNLAQNDYLSLWDFFQGFLIAVFLVSIWLYISSAESPEGLTYSMMRATWTNGVNIVTVTASLILASVVFVAQRLIALVCNLSRVHLSAKGRTICGLITSVSIYLGYIIMILYALSLFGVKPSTLVGGVGVTAVVFSMGANSLSADVLAGLFIIFEGDFTVDDYVEIGTFSGRVIDIGMRTTKVMDRATHNVLIVNNSTIKSLVNKSRGTASIPVRIPLPGTKDVAECEAIIRSAIEKLPSILPEIIGDPIYLGVTELPQKNPISGKVQGGYALVIFNCLPERRGLLSLKINNELLDTVQELLREP